MNDTSTQCGQQALSVNSGLCICLQLRYQREKAKAQQARAARQAATLRKFWHMHSGVTWQDALLVSLFTSSMAGLAYLWPQLSHSLKQSSQQQQRLHECVAEAEAVNGQSLRQSSQQQQSLHDVLLKLRQQIQRQHEAV